MTAQLADVRERGEPIASLWASEDTVYGRSGYGALIAGGPGPAPARHRGSAAGPARARGPGAPGRPRRGAPRFPRIYERIRQRRPGFVSRSKPWWDTRILDDNEFRRGGAGPMNRVLLEIDGRPAGYAIYRIFSTRPSGSARCGCRRRSVSTRAGRVRSGASCSESTGWTTSRCGSCPSTTRSGTSSPGRARSG